MHLVHQMPLRNTQRPPVSCAHARVAQQQTGWRYAVKQLNNQPNVNDGLD